MVTFAWGGLKLKHSVLTSFADVVMVRGLAWGSTDGDRIRALSLSLEITWMLIKLKGKFCLPVTYSIIFGCSYGGDELGWGSPGEEGSYLTPAPNAPGRCR